MRKKEGLRTLTFKRCAIAFIVVAVILCFIDSWLIVIPLLTIIKSNGGDWIGSNNGVTSIVDAGESNDTPSFSSQVGSSNENEHIVQKALTATATEAGNATELTSKASEDKNVSSDDLQDRRDGSGPDLEDFPVTRWWGKRKQNTEKLVLPVPTLYRQFDWIFHSAKKDIFADPLMRGRMNTTRDPRFVLVQPTRNILKRALHEIEKLPRAGKKRRILVMFGGDTRFSQLEDLVEKLAPFFEKIYYEALDKRPVFHSFNGKREHVVSVKPCPIGLQEFYFRETDQEAFRKLAKLKNVPKTREVLSSFGAWWPNLSLKIPSRISLGKLCANMRGEELMQNAGQNRTDAGATGEFKSHPMDAGRRFLKSKGPEADGGNRMVTQWLTCNNEIPKFDWPKELSKYKFMLYPAGNGVQSPKWLEALLLGTIPIALREEETEPTFQQLKEAGFPMVLVDAWEEVSVQGNRDRWWAELSGTLDLVRTRGWLTTAGWMEYFRHAKVHPEVVVQT